MAKLRGDLKLVLSRETVRRFFVDEFLTSYCDIQGDLIKIEVNGSDNSGFLTLYIAAPLPEAKNPQPKGE